VKNASNEKWFSRWSGSRQSAAILAMVTSTGHINSGCTVSV
jgi:hypothetical protein